MHICTCKSVTEIDAPQVSSSRDWTEGGGDGEGRE